MADKKTDNQAKAGLNRKRHFTGALLIGIVFGYFTAATYGLLTLPYLLAFSMLGTLGFWSASMLVLAIVEANRELNSEVPALERIQAKLNRLQDEGKVQRVQRTA